MKPTLLDLAPNKTIGRVDVTWPHAEQVGWGGWRSGSRRACSPMWIHESGAASPTRAETLLPLRKAKKITSCFRSAARRARSSFFHTLAGPVPWRLAAPLFRHSDAEGRTHTGWSNFITLSQAVSVQDPGLCAACPALRTGNMAQTT